MSLLYCLPSLKRDVRVLDIGPCYKRGVLYIVMSICSSICHEREIAINKHVS